MMISIEIKIWINSTKFKELILPDNLVLIVVTIITTTTTTKELLKSNLYLICQLIIPQIIGNNLTLIDQLLVTIIMSQTTKH